MDQIAAVVEIGDQKQKVDRYREIFQTVLSTGEARELMAFLDHGEKARASEQSRRCSDTTLPLGSLSALTSNAPLNCFFFCYCCW